MHPSPLPHLPPDIVRHHVDTLLGVLPAPVPDTPEGRAARDEAALAALAALAPADAFDITLAVQIVGVNAHVMDCLRRSSQRDLGLRDSLRWRAQAMSLMRCMLDARRALLQRHVARAKAVARAGSAPVRRPEPANEAPAQAMPAQRVVH